MMVVSNLFCQLEFDNNNCVLISAFVGIMRCLDFAICERLLVLGVWNFVLSGIRRLKVSCLF